MSVYAIYKSVFAPYSHMTEEEIRVKKLKKQMIPIMMRGYSTSSNELVNQIAYSAGSSTYVLPEHITQLRCDGVVEYTYEWYGWRVGGSNTAWDITRNSTQNYNEHTGTRITPRKQRQELLDLVISTPPV